MYITYTYYSAPYGVLRTRYADTVVLVAVEPGLGQFVAERAQTE